ncbi:MAG: DNA repair protein RadC [Actinomycetota bacterium]
MREPDPTRLAALPGSQRPRERLARLGPASLSDQELLAILLRTGGRRANAVDLAEGLLRRYGSVGELASAEPVDLLRLSDMGPAKVSSVVAAFELGRRTANGESPRTVISGPEDILLAVRPLLGAKSHEEVVVLVVGPGNRLRSVVPMTRGGPDRCLLIVRDVISTVFRHGGTGFAVAHNHPSGNCEPSAEDVVVTRRIEQAAGTVGLNFLDHLVVAGSSWKSAATQPR